MATDDPLPIDAACDLPDDADDPARARQRRLNRRRVLIGAGLFVLVGVLLQVAGPCLAPPGISEGPMVQQVGETSATIIWNLNRAAPCTFSYVDAAGVQQTALVEAEGVHNRVTLAGLAANQRTQYEIRGNGRLFAQAELHSNKPAGVPFTFAVFGDSGEATKGQYLIAGQVAAQAPDFIVHTGDLIYPAGARNGFRERFFDPYRRLLGEIPFWPCLGNHDVSDGQNGQAYREVFDLPQNGPAGLTPETNYWFDYASARFAVLDSDLDETILRTMIAPWLTQVLTTNPPRWRFVVFHHPPYTAAKHSPSEAVRAALVPIFDQVGVDLVFNGHDHVYERTRPLKNGQIVAPGAGVVYIVSGAGGASLYKVKPAEQRPDWLAAWYDQSHSFTQVTIDGDRLNLRQISETGEQVDEWSLSKP